MTGSDGDFDDFVTARWHELHAVAAVTTGHPDSATQITAAALAALADRWAELTSAGSPTATARTAVMTAALTAASSAPPTGVTDVPALDDAREAGVDLDTATRTALTELLAAAPATARAALAAARWWDETPALVAACGHTDTATVEAELSRLERDLRDAHARARGRPAGELTWALPAALADALEHAAGTTNVTDPVARVLAARGATRRRRRRVVVLAAAGLLTAAGVVAALAWPGTTPAEVTALPPDAQGWAVLTGWTPRGPLAGHPAVTTIAADQGAGPGAHLLFAGPVGDTIAVVMTAAADAATHPAGVPVADGATGPADGGVRLRLWTAPVSRGPAALTPTHIEGDDTARTPDVVALSIDQEAVGAPAVLVMTRPTVTSASITLGALPRPDGGALPVVHELPLTNGVAHYTAEADAFTLQLAVNGFRGPPAGVGPERSRLPAHGPATELAAAQRTLLAAVTGHPADTLRTPTALESVVDITDIDPGRARADPGPVQITVVTTTTPDGGWVRTTRLSSTTPGFTVAYLERLAAVPADDHTHALLRSPAVGHPTFIALGPDAATAVLVTTDGQVRDTATITNGLAVLTSTTDPADTTFRLRLLAPDGHTVFDQVPPTPDELLD